LSVKERGVVFTAPLDPEALNRHLQAVSHMLRDPVLGDQVLTPSSRFTVLLPAYTAVLLVILVPSGWVCTKQRGVLRVESNYYSENITVAVKSDGRDVTATPFPLTAPLELDFGAYYVKRDRVEVLMHNYTGVDATVIIQLSSNLLRENIYNTIYEPVTRRAHELLVELVEVRSK
jgi:hypothetical protein